MKMKINTIVLKFSKNNKNIKEIITLNKINLLNKQINLNTIVLNLKIQL